MYVTSAPAWRGADSTWGYAAPPIDPQLAVLQAQLRAIAAQLDALIASMSAPPPAAPWPAPWPSPWPTTPPAPAPTPAPARRATDFTVSSFNVLGSSHTVPGRSERPGMATGVARIRSAADLLEEHGVDVVGFQEFQGDQFREFQRVTRGTYEVYPGFKLGKPEVVNSIAWRKDTWDLVKPGFVEIPYFNGQTRKMPVVRLRHKATGQEVYFANFHNPASTRKHPGQQHWRDVATREEIALANRLHATGLPVIFTGDMNERDEYFDRLTRGAPMHAANQGPGGEAPKSMGIDWIFGTPDVRFDHYVRDRGAQVRRTTDHPMIVSQAHIPVRR